jgi:hypothetical protein
VSYRRTEISGFELSDLNENEVKIIKSNAPSLQQVSTKKRENEKNRPDSENVKTTFFKKNPASIEHSTNSEYIPTAKMIVRPA